MRIKRKQVNTWMSGCYFSIFKRRPCKKIIEKLLSAKNIVRPPTGGVLTSISTFEVYAMGIRLISDAIISFVSNTLIFRNPRRVLMGDPRYLLKADVHANLQKGYISISLWIRNVLTHSVVSFKSHLNS